ncbi:hypothetical protein, partial [Vibrio parahaemolyticus]|uniref:hypothetical protein n=1 Tax=Vibrio parahaemolyticus TaxID=670 RepID=UPI001F365286
GYMQRAEAYLRFVMYFLQNKALTSLKKKTLPLTIKPSFSDLIAGSTPSLNCDGACLFLKVLE